MSDPAPLRVWVFIDGQNCYRDARRAFHGDSGPASSGWFSPKGVAELLLGRPPDTETRPRNLEQVIVYTGMPSPTKEPKSHSAHMKQRASWLAQGVKVAKRQLRYPDDWPNTPAQEKGIDVSLAVDLVFNGARRFYDVGVVFSTDTDLVPALEAVCELHRAWGTPKIEVASWGPTKKRLRVEGIPIWCYWLDEADYQSVRDSTNYTL